MSVEPGGTFRGALYPRRADVSPDGRYLLYFAMRSSPTGDWPWQFSGLSRAPWLTCLIAWKETGTWTRGMHFTGKAQGYPEIPGRAYLHHVAESMDRCPWNIARNTPLQLAAERRLGWTETEDSPPRRPNDLWDERRRAVLEKRRPKGREALRVTLSSYLADNASLIEGHQNLYSLLSAGGQVTNLPAYCWLDWLDDERVYGATCDGRLVVSTWRAGEFVETWSHAFAPQPPRRPSPDWARTW